MIHSQYQMYLEARRLLISHAFFLVLLSSSLAMTQDAQASPESVGARRLRPPPGGRPWTHLESHSGNRQGKNISSLLISLGLD
jgi:hypothetical protein